MNANEAIDDLYTILGQHNGEYMDYASYANAVDNLNIISNFVVGTRWIPVSERLPEKNGQYLVYSGWVRTLLCLYGEWACDPKESPVTHWMPLPEPPQEVE